MIGVDSGGLLMRWGWLVKKRLTIYLNG